MGQSFPGVYIEEIPSGLRAVEGVATSIAAFIGRAARGPRNEPTPVAGWADFQRSFGALDPNYSMGYCVRDFFANGGTQALIVRLRAAQAAAQSSSDGGALAASDYLGDVRAKTGIYALDKADLFNLLCIPPDTRTGDTDPLVYSAAMRYCESRRAMLIVDSPHAWGANKNTAAADARAGLPALGLTGQGARNAALYFPRVIQADPSRDNQPDMFVPCGMVAGMIARTDMQRGVWKAPAGTGAELRGVLGLQVSLGDAENAVLNPLGINCLRMFAAGPVVWGARTLRGADELADEYKYIPVRRLALLIEESLYRGTKWVVFEPNDEPLWAQIRLNIGAFMHNLFRQGAFQGVTPREAYIVKCDHETTTHDDISRGVVNIVVGFAALKPAEFVIIKLQLQAGQREA